MSDDYPEQPYPRNRGMMPAGTAEFATHAGVGPMGLGDTRDWRDPFFEDAAWEQYSKVPTSYTVTVTVTPELGRPVRNNTQIRPEPFVLRRITWADTGDVQQNAQPLADFFQFGSASQHARCVEMRWGDSFTDFIDEPALIPAMFGDSDGFLDISGTLLFQGSQMLAVECTRLDWPFETTTFEPPTYNVDFDFKFEGIMLLPRGVAQSGSAG